MKKEAFSMRYYVLHSDLYLAECPESIRLEGIYLWLAKCDVISR
jgi:hypothetical protein